MERKSEIVSAGGNHVTVKEVSGIVSVYRDWEQFFRRPDADNMCIVYVKKCHELARIVTTKMVMN